jgi:hypothetical protein
VPELTDTSQLILAFDARAEALRARSIADASPGAFCIERSGKRGTRRIEENASIGCRRLCLFHLVLGSDPDDRNPNCHRLRRLLS